MPKQTFNKAGKTYDDFAEPQRWAAAHLLTKIPTSAEPQKILELGCGTGLLTHHLRERFPASSITAVDAAEGMIQAARTRPGLGDVTWRVEDIQHTPVPQGTDLLISGCTLHWLEGLSRLFSKLRKEAADDTRLVFSIMLKGTVAEVHDVRRTVLPHHPQPEELPALEEILEHCRQGGWTVEEKEELPYCTRFTTAWELLQSLQRTGVTGGRYGTRGRPLYRKDLRRLMDELTDTYGQHPDGIPLHYQVGFVSCRAR